MTYGRAGSTEIIGSIFRIADDTYVILRIIPHPK